MPESKYNAWEPRRQKFKDKEKKNSASTSESIKETVTIFDTEALLDNILQVYLLCSGLNYGEIMA